MKLRRTLLATGAAAVAGAAAATWTLRPRRPAPREVAPLPALRGAGHTSGERPPNVLLVMTDQERADLPAALPLPGHEWLREHHGVSFEQFHVNTTPCSPSRSNFYFGQHTQRTRMVVNLGVYPEPEIPAAMPSLGHYFRANGYTTAYKGKWHLSELRAHYELTYGHYPHSRDALEPFGFADYNFDGDPHGATWTGYKFDAQIAAEAAHWLHTRGRGSTAPWLLAVNFVNPHDVMYVATSQVQVASRLSRDYLAPLAGPPADAFYARRWNLPLPANRHDDLAGKPWAHRNYREFCDMAFGRVANDEAAWQAYQDYYFNCIRDADRHLLTVLNALEGSGEAARTIVVFTADHGEMAGAHGLRQKGPFIYQENTRVPFIVRHPDVRGGGTRTTALGSAVDLIPTLLELAGFERERIASAYPQLAGVSIAAAAAEPAARTERDARGHLFNYNVTHYIDTAFAAELNLRGAAADRWMPLRALAAGMRPFPGRHQPAFFRGIHTGAHKFARYFKPAEHHRPQDWTTLTQHNQLELYDLQADPLELDNLAADAGKARPLALALNKRLDGLIQREVGEDLGDELAGPAFLKRL
ncbi:MAG: sulfatase-like hydrolase/transferase [Rubrivivax sp.]|nr:sulfatase-like hydrolase/transferase [Rubrivivax sp.]